MRLLGLLGGAKPEARPQKPTYLPDDTDLGDLDRKFRETATVQLAHAGLSASPGKAEARVDFRVKAPDGCPGVQYRRSKRLDDRHPRYAKDGDTVSGHVEDDEVWLRIGETCFLPIRVNGIPVLEPLSRDGSLEGSYVSELAGAGTVEAQRLPPQGGDLPDDLEAKATPPMELTAVVPESFRPGQSVLLEGPHGAIKLQPPEGACPGETLRSRLAPAAEFKVQVPPGAGPGDQTRFRRHDGVEISVSVPPGLKPGDTFEVTPPCLMVLVPEGVCPGQSLVFRGPDETQTGEIERFRAQVPKGVLPGGYFAARIPLPGLVRDAHIE